MAPQADIERPSDDPFSLMDSNWPSESEGAYHAAELNADALSTATTTQAESADDAERKMASESGKAAEAVAGGYGAVAEQLRGQSRDYTTISAWMLDAGGKVGKAKSQIADLVSSGTQDIRDALTCELKGTPASPSSNDLIARYRSDIASVASRLSTDLDAIGHSLGGDPGASRTPTYTSIPTSPTAEHPRPTVEVAAYNHGDQPEVEPRQLPPMPRATSTPSGTELTGVPGTPSTPSAPTHSVNPTLAGLIAGSGPSGTPTAPSASAKSSSGTTANNPTGQAHQATETHQNVKPPVLPRIPSIGLPNVPAAAAESIVTAVSSATASQLPTAAPATPTLPASTGLTPGTSGTPPALPTPPAGLAPIGGSLPTAPPVVQPATPAPQGASPATSPAAPTPSPQAPAPAPRGPAADLGWIQRTYGLSPSLDLPKPENPIAPARFIIDLSEEEAHLHRVLATLRQQFEAAGWSQPLAVATIRRGFETRTVYVTADGLSIHPSGVRLPSGVNPLDEMPSTPSSHDLDGSLMVTDKLRSLIPREWTVEQVLSTVSGGEGSQSAEEYQELVESGELLECTAARGRDDVGVDEALRMFARAALGSGGCGELGAESARLRAARWVGVQPQGYLDVLGRWYLADAAEAMSRGSWGEAVYSAEKYMFIRSAENKAA
ncbi:hypothetical protein ABG82_19640 [Mycobacteroides immunogenum]|uniref:Uncharacterized protein n=2 Tax=Mycobacteriaceae TaxID=1762 RepID=A0A7V8RUS4_9MYCO|nr:hypothetical protein [Mycobacteroides immunogenum]AMT72176.1 hypothetical protein ABG82_19640 [Mycobacteroides immunogenum]ANO05307.1 hypothetical protein BAB75_19895 [Mycobacteroides immunogenum]KIU37963.1 hypothetical protein TL11_24635 [Mycobacteroides immunogenum]KPG04180.1 hypothetical protein AN909_23125 [Mycobacteroides immunogenum]KPG04926.1 hypothetical protein AN908_24085 [Mycobacteroides immunogenum]